MDDFFRIFGIGGGLDSFYSGAQQAGESETCGRRGLHYNVIIQFGREIAIAFINHNQRR
jgi:hypothetical protein